MLGEAFLGMRRLQREVGEKAGNKAEACPGSTAILRIVTRFGSVATNDEVI